MADLTAGLPHPESSGRKHLKLQKPLELISRKQQTLHEKGEKSSPARWQPPDPVILNQTKWKYRNILNLLLKKKTQTNSNELDSN